MASKSKLPTASSITLEQFKAVLSRYGELITKLSKEKDGKDSLKALDEERLQATEGKSLEKDKVVRLVRWKLKHGTFRPSLLSLVSSNDASLVKSTTSKAFQAYTASDTKSSPPSTAIKTLATLKGIGPATASLLLAVHDPINVPFFSDEVFRWVVGESDWKKTIKYNEKEYRELWEGVKQLRERLGEEILAREVEQVGFIIGKSAEGIVDLETIGESSGKTPGNKEEIGKDNNEMKVEKAEKAIAKPKRKAEELPPATADAAKRADDEAKMPERRSKRTKK